MPEPVEPVPDDKPSPNPADWLVGAEEGLAAEMDRVQSDSAAMARPALLRPGTLPGTAPPAPLAPDGAIEPGSGVPPGVPLPPPSSTTPSATRRRFGAVTPDLAPSTDFEHGPAMTWEPGHSSVPKLRRGAPAPVAPSPTREFPMDDAEERTRERTAVLEEALADALAARTREAALPEAFDGATVPMPWWIQGVHVLCTDRRLQLMIFAGLSVLAAIAFWPRGDRPTSIGRIRHHPERYDGANVQVAGRVGQVFHVGGGYAFYLVDVNDTLVVFTRTRVPVERQRVRVNGTMSNGSLDGQPTLALFEEVGAGR